jgi:hypothetical protein
MHCIESRFPSNRVRMPRRPKLLMQSCQLRRSKSRSNVREPADQLIENRFVVMRSIRRPARQRRRHSDEPMRKEYVNVCRTIRSVRITYANPTRVYRLKSDSDYYLVADAAPPLDDATRQTVRSSLYSWWPGGVTNIFVGRSPSPRVRQSRYGSISRRRVTNC